MNTSGTLFRASCFLILAVAFSQLALAADPGLTSIDLSITKSGPSSVSAGTDATYTLAIVNPHPQVPVRATVTDNLPAGWSLVSSNSPSGNCIANGSTVTCQDVDLPAQSTVTITLKVHNPFLCQPSTASNTAAVTFATGTPPTVSDPNLANNTSTINIAILQTTLGPGQCHPPGSQISDDKPGSILFYGLYTSAATSNDPQNNSRVSLTNTNSQLGVAVHLFFVDGASCSVADAFLCLTPNQTATFLMSDVDPGITGYIVAIAVDGPAGTADGNNTGCPVSFNYLIGSVFVKMTMSPRREAELAAESCASEFGSPVPGCNPNSSTAAINFNGIPGQGYNRLPRVLASSSIPARADGNSTLLVINRIGGNLGTGAAALGTLFGILYDDAENSASFSLSGSCQIRGELTNNFPRTTPRFENFIPAGRTGWLKVWGENDIGLIGATINQNRNANAVANAFDGGHNMHKLTLAGSVTLTVPIFPPSC
ncbi:MAG TPA: DUF11 domain-containing protein [Blastocatellia bacterium]|nr:DUF11 domain-containing protein [Blastocatellia bacterium]